ncbi:MAG: AAA family ATPase, partial [Bacteriovorax sp.]
MSIDFKIIALKLYDGINPNFLKVLKTNRIYFLEREYQIEDYDDVPLKISTAEINPEDFFQIKTELEIPDTKINFSAIVGQNGSGKSSLVEIIYAALNNISVSKGVISAKRTVKHILVDIFYKKGNDVFLLKCNDKGHRTYRFSKGHGKGAKLHELYLLKKFDEGAELNTLFYTVAVNYSHYALNSREVGTWIDNVFHKNDAYQTPLVINPYREEGKININNENYLVKARLISNILHPIPEGMKEEDTVRNIVNGKIADRITFILDKEKFKYDKAKKPTFELTEKYGKKILKVVYKWFLKNEKFTPSDKLLNQYAQEYIINKLITISERYKPYWTFQNFHEDSGNKKLIAYVKKLSKDPSHIAFKIRQAVNYLYFDIFDKEEERLNFMLSDLSKVINKIKDENNLRLIDIIPPSFFQSTISFKGRGSFEKLSSGEKQKVYTISSIIYHLININSVYEANNLIKYDCVNVIFDEIELYYHPEFQRTFVKDIIKNLSRIEMPFVKGINFILITHSPFILSDIPANKILFLTDEGLPIRDTIKKRTFGANVHDLLADSFFFSNGYLGEFAKMKITSAIAYLKSIMKGDVLATDWKQESVRHFIDLIGEPLIKTSLKDMYNSAFLTSKSEIDKEIIIKYAKKYKVSSIILFGSSTQKDRESNDIDIGVK